MSQPPASPTRFLRPAATLAAALGLALACVQGAAARTEPASDEAVAQSFVAAAKAQDRQTALNLLDQSVSIEFPVAASMDEHGRAEGRAFVIGYFDGLFDGRRQFQLDSTAVAAGAGGGDVRFLAHDVVSHEAYGLEVEVRHQLIVSLKVNMVPASQVPAEVSGAGPQDKALMAAF